MKKFVEADPYPWPYNGDLRPENTALIVIDMQTDFCGKGGYIDLLGYDISNSRACIAPIQRVLAKLRPLGYHLDPSVGQVLGEAAQPQLECTRSHPPAEADTLHPALHPRSQPDIGGRPHQRPFLGRGWQTGQL